MLFSDIHFFVSFIAYFLLHVVVPPAHRIFLIIVGSTIFYAWWRVDYVWLPYLLTFIALDTGVWWSERAPDEDARRRRLIVGLIHFLCHWPSSSTPISSRTMSLAYSFQ